ncbi:3-mercaptopyruvate sulfurtransferase [Methylobacterium gnaphalii]|uniref:3-mercaptopyruvate sulfurtransferase n=1 Tax=Methylobacterium gnaphalii TaxID=1010610 RepID=A0A512JL93_9HYPH|nr:3-mercaptopyruvate sulfurtransferase [Methylobacterium gnaphalii]GEP10720.1 sulfurtransferase [Methylobacterium gnaphalii]GJD67408.1 3-mercaptopyruvate sulfurtransferase [Methylobacterium gnaphalii]GLS49260.1 sulfurtransferase [Methylobacterium gnaphalii]
MATQPFVTPKWLEARLSAPDIVVLDASWYLPAQGRDAEAEYQAAHVPGAIRFDLDAMSDESSPLPHMLPRPDVFSSRMRALGVGDGAQIVVYDGMGLFSAPRVWWMLRTYGVRDAVILEGGLPAWIAAGYPTEDGPGRPRERRHFTARFDHAAVADANDVARALDRNTAQIVDARSGPRFRGEEAEPRPGVRPGHMPGARNVHYAALQANGRLKDEASLRAAFAEAGVDLDQPVITTCGSGVTAAIVGLALETLGRPPRALYDGSWTDWGSDETRAVATGPA